MADHYPYAKHRGYGDPGGVLFSHREARSFAPEAARAADLMSRITEALLRLGKRALFKQSKWHWHTSGGVAGGVTVGFGVGFNEGVISLFTDPSPKPDWDHRTGEVTLRYYTGGMTLGTSKEGLSASPMDWTNFGKLFILPFNEDFDSPKDFLAPGLRGGPILMVTGDASIIGGVGGAITYLGVSQMLVSVVKSLAAHVAALRNVLSAPPPSSFRQAVSRSGEQLFDEVKIMADVSQLAALAGMGQMSGGSALARAVLFSAGPEVAAAASIAQAGLGVFVGGLREVNIADLDQLGNEIGAERMQRQADAVGRLFGVPGKAPAQQGSQQGPFGGGGGFDPKQ